ncbi:hypothetical protein LCGC14_1741290 [marine sediment metagenome]|uniref:KTSC domain-containing protein n=1 Tax=marine sediment metagenome TaxID=412755 RepID=A0A0F9K6B1_9ZZZZ
MAKVKMVSVESSNIEAVGYDEQKEELFIEFKNKGENTTYKYRGVPSKKYDSMVKADSVGRFFHKHIRGLYTFKKLRNE